MTYLPTPRSALAWALLAAVSLGCSGGDLVLPQTGGNALRLAVVGGDQQTGTVGEPLPQPLTVEVRDEQGHRLAGRKVAFVVTSGPANSTLSPSSARTNDAGQALGLWLLGTKTGSYTAEVRALASPGDAPDMELPTVEFTASAQAGAPDTLRAESETSQAGTIGQPVPEAPLVRVTDRYGNPVAGVPVHWKITSGRGSVSAPVVSTDADGHATVTWTVSKRIGVDRLEASVDGDLNGSPIVFTAVVF